MTAASPTGPASSDPAGSGPAGTGPAGTGPAGTGPAGTGPVGPVGQEVLLDNDRVRVWHVQLGPGETQPLHHHGLPYVVVAVQGAKSVIHTAAGDRIDIVENTGDVIFRDPGQVHMLTNVGDTVYIGRVIELKTDEHLS